MPPGRNDLLVKIATWGTLLVLLGCLGIAIRNVAQSSAGSWPWLISVSASAVISYVMWIEIRRSARGSGRPGGERDAE